MFEFILLALVLGIKHSFDPDHLLAVSNLLRKVKSLKNSVKMAIIWAAGHMITASLVTLILISFKDSFLSFLLDKFEIIVALMLIALGFISLSNSRIVEKHEHEHNGKKHSHLHLHLKKDITNHDHIHMFGIGIVHGLASNDELLILITISLGVSSVIYMLFGVAIFSLGVVIGMIIFTLVITYPLLKIHSSKLDGIGNSINLERSSRLTRLVNLFVGCISILYGVIMFVNL